MELTELRITLRRHWRVALAVFAAVVLVGMAATVLSEKRYQSSVVVLVQPSPEQLQLGSVQLVLTMMPNLVARSESLSFRDDAWDRVDPALASAPIRVNAVDDPGTGILRIAVTAPRADAAAAWANALAQELMAQENGPLVNLSVIDPAAVRPDPVSPQAKVNLLASGVLGFLAAMFAAFGANRLDEGRDVEQEIRRRLDVPVLGQIPRLPQLERAPFPSADGFDQAPGQLLEAFQALRTAFMFQLVDQQPGSVAVSSYSPGEGKSTVSAGLGWALAAVGQRVTLVDANLRHPTLHQLTAVPPTHGLADVSGADPNRLLRPARGPAGLAVLAAGAARGHPADVLTAALPEALAALASPDHLALVDGPSLEGMAETPFILATTTHALLVIDARSTAIPELERAVVRLREAGVVVIGVVLNRVTPPRRRRGKVPGTEWNGRRPAGASLPGHRPSGVATTPERRGP